VLELRWTQFVNRKASTLTCEIYKWVGNALLGSLSDLKAVQVDV
jgi:hypothetical protein